MNDRPVGRAEALVGPGSNCHFLFEFRDQMCFQSSDSLGSTKNRHRIAKIGTNFVESNSSKERQREGKGATSEEYIGQIEAHKFK